MSILDRLFFWRGNQVPGQPSQDTNGFVDTVIPHRKMYGEFTLNVLSGQSLKVEASPGGTEALNKSVPAGKRWEVQVKVQIVETEA